MKVGLWKRVNHDLFTHLKRNIDFTGSLLRMSSNKSCGTYDLELDIFDRLILLTSLSRWWQRQPFFPSVFLRLAATLFFFCFSHVLDLDI